jgi:hypothetical protein
VASGVHAPRLAALFAAAFVAWLQAFAWMPYGLPGLRMIVAVLWLTTIDVVVFTAVELQVRESLMILILAPLVPLAYLAGRYAVGQARCGDNSRLAGCLHPARRDRRRPSRRTRCFPGRPRADVVRGRQHGRSLPAWVAILVPFEVLFLYIVRHEPPVLTMIASSSICLRRPSWPPSWR